MRSSASCVNNKRLPDYSLQTEQLHSDEKKRSAVICKYPFSAAEACVFKGSLHAYPIIMPIKLITPTVLCRLGEGGRERK